MKEKINAFLQGVKTLSVVCYQWGDTGKGKFVDLFAEWADIIARGTGGDNAGHTIFYDNCAHVFHLIPSGILYDKYGKINVIGSGTVINPRTLILEIKRLLRDGMTVNNLKIALNAKLILPVHILLDRLKETEKTDKIGTTGKGITDAYLDHYGRIGLCINDLLSPDLFAKKLKKNLEEKRRLLKTYDINLVKKVLQSDDLGNGIYFHPEEIIDEEAIIQKYLEYGRFLQKFITDTDALLRKNVGKKKILLEGAQGVLLSIDYGTYPYVTSSDASAVGLAKGVGLKESDIDLQLGIIKGFYMTRVGCGPFPTEFGGKFSADFCNGQHDPDQKIMEEEEVLLGLENGRGNSNNPDSLFLGKVLRVKGGEYGATTGRPRRTGWLDLPLLRYVMEVSGQKNLILTKLDILDSLNQVDPYLYIKVCYAYRYIGEDPYCYGDKIIQKNDPVEIAIPDANFLSQCEPIYDFFSLWRGDISGIRSLKEVPINLQIILNYLKRETGAKIKALSVGPRPEQTILL